MLVTRVFLQDGEYFEDGEGPYIPLEPHGTGHSNTLVSYMAYCIDFEKDNPSASETLYVERITEELLPIAVQIATYEKMYPDVDTTIGAQLALWRSQGLELGEIASIFDYSNIDVSHMNDILALAVD